jgi:putative ABC transport system permease protein
MLPPAFRRAYAGGMTTLFLDRLTRARRGSGTAVFLFWMRTAADVASTAVVEWRRAVPAAGRGLLSDVRYSARRLAAAPGFTIGVLALLGLGIGATTVVFSVVDAIALRPRPFADPSTLVRIYQNSDEGQPDSSSYPAYLDMAAMHDTFASVAAVAIGSSAMLADGAGEPHRVTLEYATASYLPTLGLTPARGRWFTAGEDRAGGPAAVVIAWHAWQRLMGGDPGALGRTIRLNARSVTIVGIGPRAFGGFVPGLETDMWVSMSGAGITPYIARGMERRGDHPFQVLARLADGVTPAQAQTAIQQLAARFDREFPETDRGRGIALFGLGAVRIHPEIDAVLFPAAATVMAIAALALIVACSNLANLLLARGLARSREIAIRLAIGATRTDVARLLLVETVLLSACGGAIGFGLAAWLLPAVATALPPAPIAGTVALSLDTRVLAFAAFVSTLTGLTFGVLPAAMGARANVVTALKERDAAAGGGSRLSLMRPRDLLVAAQLAVSVVLVVAAALLAQSVSNARGADTGVDTAHTAVIAVDPSQAGYPAPRAHAILLEIRDRLAALPGVVSAARVMRPPMTANGPSTTIEVEGYLGRGGSNVAEVSFSAVDPAYYNTMGIRLLHGRLFTDADGDRAGAVAIVSREMARRYWGTEDAVGRRYKHQASREWVSVIGVVDNVAVVSPAETPRPFMYQLYPRTVSRAFIALRADRDPAALPLAGLIRDVEPNLPAAEISTLSSRLDQALATSRAAARFLSAFAVLAAMITGVGLYSVVSFKVSRRTSEMGVRLALGARPAGIAMMVLRDTLGTLSFGLIAGLLLAAAATPVVRGLLVGVEPLDPRTFMVAAGGFAAVGLAAAWLPARRAARVSVVSALRRD